MNENLFQTLEPYLPGHLSSRLGPDIELGDALTIAIHITSIRYALSTYLPRYLVDLIGNSPTLGQVSGGFRQGTVMFADVSGFTAMSERLSALGKEGAEEITRIVNDYFETMLDISADYGGDLLKFGGDAVLLFFEGEDSAIRALATAQTMQQAMSRFAQVQTSQGVFPLQMSIGMGSGPVFLANLGLPEDMEYAVMGQALSNMAQAEDKAVAGQIMVDEATYKAVAAQAQFSSAEPGFWILKGLETIPAHFKTETDDVQTSPLISGEAEELLQNCLNQVATIRRLRPFIPDELLNRIILDPQRPSLEGSHRPVTVMFLNFYGIDEIIEALGPAHEKAITQILNTHFVTMSRILTRYDGVVNKVDTYAIGHRVMALFGALRAHEDDPQRAVRAAVEMNQALDEVNRRTVEILSDIPNLSFDFSSAPLKQRIGINSGFVFAGNVGSATRREYSVMGDEVNLTARLMGVAQEGETLISQSTARYVRKAFQLIEKEPVKVKGKTQPVKNYAVIKALEDTRRWDNLTGGALVGRDQEIQIGKEAVERVCGGESCVLTIAGASGIGKTRLAEEIAVYAGQLGFDLFVGGCLSFGKTMTFHPWADILRALFGIRPDDDQPARLQAIERAMQNIGEEDWLPVMAEILGLHVPDNDLTRALDAQLRRQRSFDLIVKLLQNRASQRRLMLVIEDAHWADPSSFDLIDYLIRNMEGHPILLVLPHRPDAGGPDWSAHANAVHLTLNDLSDEACLEIVRGLIGPVTLPASARQLIISKGGGNPFFTEEVVRALIGAGALQTTENGEMIYAADTLSVDLPDSIHGIIISRIDRLLEIDQRVLQVASIIGRIFGYDILNGVYSYGDLNGDLHDRLIYLGTLGLTETQSLELDMYRFKHLTTQEVVYQSMSFEQKRAFHRQTAQFIERTFTDSLGEQTDLLAYHYFEGQDWKKAIQFNLLAARHAQREFANDAAITGYERVLYAAKRLDPKFDVRAERIKAYESLGEVLALVGRYDEALEHYHSAQTLLESSAADVSAPLAELCRKTAEVYERRSEFGAAFEWLEAGLSYLNQKQPTVEAARNYILQAGLYYRQGKYEDAIKWAQQSLNLALRLQEREGQEAVGQTYYLLGAINMRYGDLDQAVYFCRKSITVYQQLDNIVGQSKAYNNLGLAYKNQDDWHSAAEALSLSLENFQKIGDVVQQGFVMNNLGNIHLNRGEWERAAALFEESINIWQKIGAPLFQAVTLSNLAQAHIYHQNWSQAENCLSQSQTIFNQLGSEDFLSELERRWGELYLKTNQPQQALSHTQRALELAVSQNSRLDEGVAARLLGEVHLAQGRQTEAEKALQQSLQTLQNLNNRYEIARTQLALARYSAQNNLPGAEAFRQAAVATFQSLGAQADLQASQI